ncbi:hypothetical protein, partial [Salmonella sp. SAL4355]|uniref:hypothetical protein n=1 Tax=Salmonella sp. SAL4355 TaxID=3159876 RepID=UPI00397C717B
HLFKRMLHIVVENAGADKALFLEKNNKEWIVVASLEVHPEGEEFTKIDIPVGKFKEISMTILQLALRSKVPIIFNHASTEDQLSEDPY